MKFPELSRARKRVLFTVAEAMLTASIALLVSCASKTSQTSPISPNNNPVQSDSSSLTCAQISASDAPSVSSVAVEAIWQSATPLSVLANPVGDNFQGHQSPISVEIRSVATATDIYFLVQYDDPTMDLMNQPLRFKGGDYADHASWTLDTSTYDDGFSFMFEISPASSAGKTFKDNGCAMACHTQATAKWGPGMFPENNGRFDVWSWRSSRSNATGLAEDDVSVGSPDYTTDFDDPNDQIVHYNVDNSPAYLPFYIAGGDNGGLNKQYYISETTMGSFGDAKDPVTGASWAPNDMVPSFTIGAIDPQGQSDFWDVKSRGYWSNGKWTLKFKRSLTTASSDPGSMLDVAFAKGSEYPFSFAIQDHTSPGNHYGVATRAFKLKL